MISFFSIIALGFFLGMRHATDPDHVIAVTTIVSRQRNVWKSALIGAFWGVGHTLTIFVVGVAMIIFGLVIPPRYGLSMELAVGVMLIVLGLMNVVGSKRTSVDLPVEDPHAFTHSHSHTHGDHVHAHSHTHGFPPHSHEHPPAAWLDRLLSKMRIYQPIRPLIIGIVHGLAGSAAVALLVLTTIRDPRWAVAYLLVFGLGTVAGMMLITLSIASTFHLLGNSVRFSRRLAVATGVLSLSFGLFIAYQICFVNGLLSSHPSWTPH